MVVGSRRKRLSVTEVSDMLFEFYKVNAATVPKQQVEQKQQQQQQLSKFAHISPASAETNEPSTIAAIATNGASETASKNLQADEMIYTKKMQMQNQAGTTMSFHPGKSTSGLNKKLAVTAIPTSVLVPNTIAKRQIATTSQQKQTQHAAKTVIDLKPILNATGATIAPLTAIDAKPASVIAEALVRTGLHPFQQQLCAQELLRQRNKLSSNLISSSSGVANNGEGITTNKILENLLRTQQQQQQQAHEQQKTQPDIEVESDVEIDEDDDDDTRYDFDDIHLLENATPKLGNTSLPVFPTNNNATALLEAQAQVLRKWEHTLSDYGGGSGAGSGGGGAGGGGGGGSSNTSSISPNALGPDGECMYECRHCGKKYRWKSTLRRHENVECGGKEPSHQCPYCPYKSKQRGNLGVHVRKHHTNMPQLPSKRRSKYSMGRMDGVNGGSISDDSQNKSLTDLKNESIT